MNENEKAIKLFIDLTDAKTDEEIKAIENKISRLCVYKLTKKDIEEIDKDAQKDTFY